jgi:hypothetical protein
MTEPKAPEDLLPRGRPTDYDPEFCQRAANLCIAGATDFEVAEDLGVCVRTLYRWKAQFPEFSQALKVGKELSDDRVESSLYHRAVGYSHAAVKIMQYEGVPVIVPYTEHVPPDVGAATLWLINRRGEEWRAKQVHELTGKDGIPLIPVINVVMKDGSRTELGDVPEAGAGAPVKSD